MGKALKAKVVSITTGKPQTLWLDEKDVSLLKGKKVALVDDVVSTGSTLKVLKNGCGRAHSGFERTLPEAQPMVKGKTVELPQAIETAAALIKKAQLPLFGGVATDVDGVRAALSIADHSGGVIDHALSEGQFRNLNVLQSSGWIMSTLTEARNRADLFAAQSRNQPLLLLFLGSKAMNKIGPHK